MASRLPGEPLSTDQGSRKTLRCEALCNQVCKISVTGNGGMSVLILLKGGWLNQLAVDG